MKNILNQLKKAALAVVAGCLLFGVKAQAQVVYIAAFTNQAFPTNGIQASTTNTTYNTNVAGISSSLPQGWPLNIYRQATLPVYAQLTEFTNNPANTVIGTGTISVNFAISPDGVLYVTDPNYILNIPLTVPSATNVITGWTNWASTSTTSPFPAQYIKVASIANTATNISGTNLVLEFFSK